MLAERRWVNWRYETRDGDKPTKVPYQDNGIVAIGLALIAAGVAVVGLDRFNAVRIGLAVSGIGLLIVVCGALLLAYAKAMAWRPCGARENKNHSGRFSGSD
jgi:hypothetical protein